MGGLRVSHLLVVVIAHVEGPELGAELGVRGDVVEPVGSRDSSASAAEGKPMMCTTPSRVVCRCSMGRG